MLSLIASETLSLFSIEFYSIKSNVKTCPALPAHVLPLPIPPRCIACAPCACVRFLEYGGHKPQNGTQVPPAAALQSLLTAWGRGLHIQTFSFSRNRFSTPTQHTSHFSSNLHRKYHREIPQTGSLSIYNIMHKFPIYTFSRPERFLESTRNGGIPLGLADTPQNLITILSNCY